MGLLSPEAFVRKYTNLRKAESSLASHAGKLSTLRTHFCENGPDARLRVAVCFKIYICPPGDVYRKQKTSPQLRRETLTGTSRVLERQLELDKDVSGCPGVRTRPPPLGRFLLDVSGLWSRRSLLNHACRWSRKRFGASLERSWNGPGGGVLFTTRFLRPLVGLFPSLRVPVRPC